MGMFLWHLIFSPIADIAQEFRGNVFLFFADSYYRSAATVNESHLINIIIFYSIIFFLINFNTNSYYFRQLQEIINIKIKKNGQQLYVDKTKNRMAALYGFISGIITSTFIFSVMPARLKAKYDTKLTQIVPYVDPQVINELKSDWVLMKSRKDFQNIKKNIDSIIEKQKRIKNEKQIDRQTKNDNKNII
jgi:hypothetical protein